MTSRPIVLDTNIVLDLLVFSDEASLALDAALNAGSLHWLATASMRSELARVLGYPQIMKRLDHHGLLPASVLAGFDARANMVEAAPKAPFTCRDADDQPFIDLAVAHRALLVSKDAEVLCMRRRLATLGAEVLRSYVVQAAA